MVKDKGFRCVMDKCIIQTLPVEMKCSTGNYFTFFVRREGVSFKIYCFDDEREHSPYKTILKLTKKGSLKKGTVVSLDCIESHYDQYVIRDDAWKKISKGANPTKILMNQYKLVSWDFALPLEYHLKEKKESAIQEIPPITDLSEFGG